MNPKYETERKVGGALVQEAEKLLNLRQTTDDERTALEKAGKKSEADVHGRKIVDINTRDLPALEKRIRDTANAMRDRKMRDRLEKLLKRIGIQNPAITERTVNGSREHEADLVIRLREAKTTQQRINATGEVEQLARDKKEKAEGERSIRAHQRRRSAK